MSYPGLEEIRKRRNAERRSAALAALARAEEPVRAVGGRLVVFGSLAEGGFDERSDVDVAVLGLPRGLDEEIATAVDRILSDAGFVCDVISERFLSPGLRDRVVTRGREPRTLV